MPIVRVLAVLLVVLAAGPARAQNVAGFPASACAVSEAATSGGLFLVGGSSVRFAAGTIGNFTLSCPLQKFSSATTAWNLKLTYQDSTGKLPAGQAVAQIFMLPIGTATPALLVSANSNSSAAAGLNTLASPLLTHTFNFESNIYWIRIALKRDNTTDVVAAHSVVLDGTGF